MIIDRDSDPKDTIFYVAASALEILKAQELDVETLYEVLKKEYNSSLDYNIYLLSLDFLFLLNKICISEEGFLNCL